MIGRLIDACVARRALTLSLCAAFACMAAVAASRLRIEAFPDVTNVQVMVIALYPGQAAEEIERQVTVPIERALVGLPNALAQRSVTSFGLAQVITTFKDGADIYFARQQVAERLQMLELPSGAECQLGPNDTPVGQILQYTVESPTRSATELRGLQEWTIAKHLARVPGVADVVSFGGYQRELHVVAEPAALLEQEITLDELCSAIARANQSTSGGYVRHGENEFVVRGRGYIENAHDIERSVIKTRGGVAVRVADVANVREGYTPRRGTVARGAADDSVEGAVLLRRGENPRDVLQALHLAIDAVNDHVLADDVRIVPFYDRSRLVHTTLSTVTRNMLEGVALVTIVIFLFLRTWLGSLAVAVTMPLGLLTALLGLWLLDVPANLLSMGAIDFGILLDGAVILVENCFRKLHSEKVSPENVPAVVARAAKEVVRPTLFSMGIIVVAMLPIFTLERVEGRIFRPVALTYAFALAGSLFFTITCVPALSAALFTRFPIKHQEPGFLRRLERLYRSALNAILRNPWPSRLVAVALLGLAALLVPRLGTEFLPQMNEGDIHITVSFPSTISLGEGQSLLKGMRADLLGFAEVVDVVTEQGHPEDGTDDEAPSQAKTFVMLKSPEQWRRGMTMQKLTTAMREVLERRPGVAYNFSQPIKDRIEEAISGVRGQIVVKLYGEDFTAMQAAMQGIFEIVSHLDGARDVEVYRAGVSQHVVADLDREAAGRLGLTVDDVQDVIELSFGGRIATTMWEHGRQLGVRVKLPTPTEADAASIGRLLVPTPLGPTVPLAMVAHVHPDSGRTQINRENGGRFMALKCNLEGRDMGSFVDEAERTVREQVPLPPGTTLRWGGEFENQRRAMRQLAIIVPVSLAGIFLLLYSTFAAVLPAVTVLLGLPFAAVGGVFALFVTQTTLSVSAAIGFITLFGVATMDGVLLVTYVREGWGPHVAPLANDEGRARVVDAVVQRLRPVLMTALLASLGLLPAATSHAIGADTQRPFAIVIIGGLISATLATMLLLPSLYAWVDGLSRAVRRRS